MYTVSVVTSLYNRKLRILEVIDKMFLPSLAKNGSSEMELIIIDDCSPLQAETEAVVKTHLPTLKQRFGNVIFVRNKSNLRVAGSFNRGVGMANGKYVIITNDDVYFPNHSIKRLVETLNEGYLISGPITNSAAVASFQYCKQAPRVDSYEPETFERLERFSDWLWRRMKGQRQTTDNISGFCYATGTEFFKEIGGFDESFKYGYFEDTDLIRRIVRDFGQEKVAIALDTFVPHGGVDGYSQSMLQQKFRAIYALNRNGIRFANRCGWWRLTKRLAIMALCPTGKGTISELFPKKIENI